MQEPTHNDARIMTTFFAHNTWANLKLLDFCAGLSDEQLDSTGIGCFGSIRDTLRHIVGAEVSYVERSNGALPARPLAPGQVAGFDLLTDAVRWAGDELLKLALSARQATLVRQRPPRDLIEYPLASLIVQSITHSTEHRTQIAAIITQLGLEPPDMSGWAYMEEMGEIQEYDPGATGA